MCQNGIDKKLNKWMNLEKSQEMYCGVLEPAYGVKIKYFEAKNGIPAYYQVTPSEGKYLPNTGLRNVMEEVYIEGYEKELAKYCEINLGTNYLLENTEAKVYICDGQYCKRRGDLMKVDSGVRSTRNINYASGLCYVEVRECERKGHIKLDYSIKIN